MPNICYPSALMKKSIPDKTLFTTWYMKPTPEEYQGPAFFWDVGMSGVHAISDGINWRRTSPVQLAAYRDLLPTVPSGGAATDEIRVAALFIPGGIIGPYGALALEGLFEYSNSANSKSVKFRVSGGGQVGNVDAPMIDIGSTGPTNSLSANINHIWKNQGSEAAQKAFPSLSSPYQFSGSAPISTTQDTSSDFFLFVFLQLANAADTCKLSLDVFAR